jgi:hypothetical protein
MPRSSELAWLVAVLWPDRARVMVTPSEEAPLRFRRAGTYIVIERGRRPRFLVPDSLSALRAALWRFDASTGALERLGRVVGGLALASAGWRTAPRLHIHVSSDLDRTDLPEVLLDQRLGRALGLRRARAIAFLGPARPNRKPVLQIVDGRGRAVAYAKVAWNELTRDLVAHELDVLRGWVEAPPSSFRVPRVLGIESWNGWPVGVTEAIEHRLRDARLRPADTFLIAAAREVAEREGTTSMPLCETPMWLDIGSRISRLADAARRDRLMTTAARFERWVGDLVHPVGWWHGDWTPWNMTIGPDGPVVWDWERARPGVPVGLDLVHLAFQTSRRPGGRRPWEAVALTIQALHVTLPQLGVRVSRVRPLTGFYLFEIWVRFEEALAAGAIDPREPMLSQLPEALVGLMEGSLP